MTLDALVELYLFKHFRQKVLLNAPASSSICLLVDRFEELILWFTSRNCCETEAQLVK